MAGVKRTPAAVNRAMKHLGDDLRTWRLLRRLTAAEVAERARLTRQTVLRIEKGGGAGLESVLSVARALGVLDQLASALDPYATDVGRLRADEVLPERVRHSRPRSES